MSNYYERLGLGVGASEAEIKAAFMSRKKEAQQLMLSKDAEEVKKGVNLIESFTEAYKVLKSSETRKQYDEEHGFVDTSAKMSVLETCEAFDKNLDVSQVIDEELSEDVNEVSTQETSGRVRKTMSQKIKNTGTIVSNNSTTQRSIKGKQFERTTSVKSQFGRAICVKNSNDSNRGLLFGGAIVLVAIIVILIGYIAYQEFEARDNVGHSDNITMKIPGVFSKLSNSGVTDISNNEKGLLNGERFKVYVDAKDTYDKDIAQLAGKINEHIGREGNLRNVGSQSEIWQKAQRLTQDVENLLDVYRKLPRETVVKGDKELERLLELEVIRVRALRDGIQDGARGKDYTVQFRKGTEAAYEFDRLNSEFANR